MFTHWFFTNPAVHLKAFFEALFVVGCGLLSFPLVMLVRLLHHVIDPHLPLLYLWDTIQNGQLFPFCFGIVGVILWLLSQEFEGKGVPLRPAVNLLLLVTFGTCIVIYAIQPNFDRALPTPIIYASVAILGLYFLLHYYLFVVRDMPMPDVPSTVQAGADSMMKRARSRRSGKPQ